MALTTFQESYYLQQNPDVLAAIRNGVFQNAEQHYVLFGEGEGRQPNPYFKPAGYLANNPDVLSAVTAGVFSSGLEHFEMFGVDEGRQPGADTFNEVAYLAANADVDAAVKAGTFTSGYQHFILFGSAEGRASQGTVDPNTGTEGKTFTLTAAVGGAGGVDTLTGTSGDDVFRAVTPLSLETQDTLDGGAGNDTLNISAGGAVSGAAPVLKNIETINITGAAAAGLNLTDSTGIRTVNVTSTNVASVVTFNNSSLDTVFGTGKSTASGVIDIDWKASTAGANDTLKLALGDNDANAMTVRSTVDAGTIENVTIAANGSTSGANVAADTIVLDAVSITNKTLTVTGAGHANITNASVNLTTVDASAATGNNTYIVNGAAAKTVKAGSGNDTIVAGAGADTIIGGKGADTMTGGAGNDKFVIETSTIEDLGFDNITDFITTADTIAFVGGVAGSATNYVEVVSTGVGFVTARSAAQTQLAGDANLKYVAVSDFGGAGNTYVFFDGDGDGKLTTNGSDHAVILTGIATGAGIDFADIVAG